jgi:hypothetical protein
MDVHDPTDWKGIEQAYVKGDWSLRRIAEAFGTSRWTLANRAAKEGWVREVGTKPLAPGRKPRPPGVPPPPRPNAQQVRARRIMARLFAALDEKMKALEARIAHAQDEAAPPPSAADAERDARTLSSLARLYAKLVELDDRAREQDGGPKGSETDAARSEALPDADRLRRDLALRLQRLNPGQDA